MKRVVLAVVLTALMVLWVPSVRAGVVFQNEDGDYMELGGRIQLQYHVVDADGGDDEDTLFFRRLRPYIVGSLHDEWMGKFEFDFGKGDVAIKDAYLKYTGFEQVWVALGNMNFPYSREFVTSSKKQQLVERTFVGDHNYGTPDRQTGVHLGGGFADKLVTWGMAAAIASHDPDDRKLDWEPTIQIDKGDDWSDGPMVGAMIEVFPFGYMKAEQGAMSSDLRAVIGAAAYAWLNDDDNLDVERSKHDLDNAAGFEVHAGLRVGGFSADAQFNMSDAELVEETVTSGLYENGETTLTSYALEGGYMVLPRKLELVAGYQAQDADNYETEWTRASVGANWFVKKHDIKYQLTYRMGENVNGEEGADRDEIFLQAQYVF